LFNSYLLNYLFFVLLIYYYILFKFSPAVLFLPSGWLTALQRQRASGHGCGPSSYRLKSISPPLFIDLSLKTGAITPKRAVLGGFYSRKRFYKFTQQIYKLFL